MKQSKYWFSGEIQNALEDFEAYLKEQGYNGNTIRQKSNYAGCFLQWLDSERLAPQDTRYNDLLNFIDGCLLEGKSRKLAGRTLDSIRAYYRYLEGAHPEIHNPAAGLFLKGARSKTVTGITDFALMETLYREYSGETARDKRDRVILGLLVYQGVTTDELHQLLVGHLKLDKGRIHIPGNRRRNSRMLELKPFQVMELHQYAQNKPADQPLFTGAKGSANLKNGLKQLFTAIQKDYPEIQSAKVLRSGAIAHWLKTHNLRQVQYMAGHKYVSSTERYQRSDLDSLQERLEKCHPLAGSQTNTFFF